VVITQLPQTVGQGKSMSQHGTTNQSTPRRILHAGLLASVAVCAIGLSGCQLAENIDVAKCMVPPNQPHEFAAPTNYGYFPTMWRPWPGAEAGPGTSPTRDKSREEVSGKQGPETLPEPDAEGNKESLEPGMEDVFDLPTAPEGDAMPGAEEPMDKAADETAPDTTVPEDLSPPNATPPADGESLPGALMPDDGPLPPPEATPEKGAWNLELLPTDAPEGALIPDDGPETAGGKNPTPALLVPEDEMGRGRGRTPKRVENALRPAPVRGASATEPVKGNAFRSFSRDIKIAEKSSSDNSEGPALAVPTQIENSPTRKPAVAQSVSDEQSSDDKLPADKVSMGKSSAGKSAEGWRANAARPQAKQRTLTSTASSNSEGWQRRPSRTVYPAQQTAHAESQPQPSDSLGVSTASDAGNPLR
jgi:hypothetical protein